MLIRQYKNANCNFKIEHQPNDLGTTEHKCLSLFNFQFTFCNEQFAIKKHVQNPRKKHLDADNSDAFIDHIFKRLFDQHSQSLIRA
jgi:hypothetical protein